MKVYTSDKEKEFLLTHVNKNIDMLEYGSGGSTVFLQDKVKSITSIEHDSSWFNETKKHLSDNVSYYLLAPDNLNWEQQYDNHNRKNSKGDDGSFEDFAQYVTFPVSLKKKFDLIFVDGRARLSCAFVARSLLKDGGKLLIHDFGADTSHPYLPYRTYYDNVYLWYNYDSHVETMYCFTPISV